MELKNKVIAFDFGEVRVGIAISDMLRIIATPLTTVCMKNKKNGMQEIWKILDKNDPNPIVVGLPKNLHNIESKMEIKAKEFAKLIQDKYPTKNVILRDERFTSKIAQNYLQQMGKNVKKSRKIIDQCAAQVILQGFLDEGKSFDDIDLDSEYGNFN